MCVASESQALQSIGSTRAVRVCREAVSSHTPTVVQVHIPLETQVEMQSKFIA